MSSLSFLSVSPIYLGKAEGNGGNVINMVIVFKTFFIPFYKWVFKLEGVKVHNDNVVCCTPNSGGVDSCLCVVMQS